MRVCEHKIAIQARLLVDPTRKEQVDRRTLRQPELVLNLASREVAYVSLSPDGLWVEIDRAKGEELKLKIESEARGYEARLARDLFTTNRYGVICADCLRLVPEDAVFEVLPEQLSR